MRKRFAITAPRFSSRPHQRYPADRLLRFSKVSPIPRSVGRICGFSVDGHRPPLQKIDKNNLVRFVWLNLSPKSARMEQSFSPDGGKTWETNWICELTR
jgi:hypothetical protein